MSPSLTWLVAALGVLHVIPSGGLGQHVAPPPPAPTIIVTITTSGTNTAGQTYRLVCSVTVTGSSNLPHIVWLDPTSSQFPSDMVSTMGSMSTLTFNPLSASHAGTYTCRAAVGGGAGVDLELVTVQSKK